MVDNLPNFLIVGASKAGTSSVWNYLNEHPDIYLPRPKEPLFFIKDVYNKFNPNDPGYSAIKDIIIQNEKSYSEVFSTRAKYKCKGEATASYLYYFNEAIPNILKTLGKNVKIIIILRNPFDKVVSHYKFYLGRGWETKSFENALQNERYRIENGYNPFYHYTNQGYYYESVKAFLKSFSNVHICFYEDLKSNPQKFLDEIFDFLEVEKINIESKNTIYNKSHVPKSKTFLKAYQHTLKNLKFLRNVLPFVNWKGIKHKILKFNEMSDFSISDIQKEELNNLYKEDIAKLETLIGINLVEKWPR